MERNHSIDAFRGLAIIGMVFFTVTLRLSSTLPEPLRHNVWGSVHVGDFILPMFLFASGLSLAYYLQKKKDQNTFFKDAIIRFGGLAIIGIMLSYFSAYCFLEMDEVMLNALLFLMCILIYRLHWVALLIVIFFINLSYLFLMHLDLTDIFIGHYLGGYPASFYYLPLMLVGLLLGQGILSDGFWCKKNKIILITISSYFLVFTILIPIHKLTATPSFMMLSLLFCIFLFIIIEQIIKYIHLFNAVENIGKTPLRYWLIMYLLFLIPLRIYTDLNSYSFPLDIPWLFGILISLGLIIVLFAFSTIFNHLYKTYKKEKYLH